MEKIDYILRSPPMRGRGSKFFVFFMIFVLHTVAPDEGAWV